MKLCWEAMGGAPGSCVRGPLTSTLEVCPKTSKSTSSSE